MVAIFDNRGKRRRKRKEKDEENFVCALVDSIEQKFRVGKGNREWSSLVGMKDLSWNAERSSGVLSEHQTLFRALVIY